MRLEELTTGESYMDKRRNFILYSSVAVVVLLYYIDAVMQVPYLWKSVIKIVVLATLFSFYSYRYKYNFIKESLDNYLKNRKTKTTDKLKHLHLGLGLLAFGGILIIYWLAAPYMHLDNIVISLQQKYGISKEQLIYYGLYLSFGNALLEEMFFRGFMFLNLRESLKRWQVYLFSSLLFSLYHISNIQSWFTPLLFLVALVGLMLAGLLFCYLDERGQTLFNSYFVHVCADLAIVLVGYRIVNMG
jgi:membrane protease YdiL (CAAX protease family)